MPDEKIRIFGQLEQSERDDSCETESLLYQINLQKENGNLAKARELGSIMAAECDSDDGEFVFGWDAKENDQVVLQRRLLLAFTIQYGIEKFCPNSIVAKTAVNQFFDTIRTTSPHIYNDIQENAAFSYYTLCSRNPLQTEECIGSTFAELSGHGDDPTYQELGKALYIRFSDLIYEKVNQLAFQVSN